MSLIAPSLASTIPAELKSKISHETETLYVPRYIDICMTLGGSNPGGNWDFLVVLNGQIVFETKWQHDLKLTIEDIPINLNDLNITARIADQPLVLLLRAPGKTKEPDPLLNLDNRAAANVDLLPLLVGEESVSVKVNLLYIETSENTGCIVDLHVNAGLGNDPRVPLLITMINASCLPPIKDGTCYLAAIGFDSLTEPVAIDFGRSLSTCNAKHINWASLEPLCYSAVSNYSCPKEDRYIPPDFQTNEKEWCSSQYWNTCRRILVEPSKLQQRLQNPLLVEIAGVPKLGKIEVRGRYMAFADARVLLQPGEYGVTICAKLLMYNESELPEGIKPLLDLPPLNLKTCKETDLIIDQSGHTSFVTIRFDLTEPLVPKVEIVDLYQMMGLLIQEEKLPPTDELHENVPPDDNIVDVRRIRKECGALAVHTELSSLTSKDTVPMNTTIKHNAANNLLARIRAMLKQFPPGDCSYLEWQDTVRGQHAASRRAVMASFAPQPPPLQTPTRFAAARARMAGDVKIANSHIQTMLLTAPSHPRSLLSKVLRCLEMSDSQTARKLLVEALKTQTRNRYLLWSYGGLEFDQGSEGTTRAYAAFRLAVKSNRTESTSKVLGWAALHALHHYCEDSPAAFVSSKKMRKFYELPCNWKAFLKRWYANSGEEESIWNPDIVASDSPLIIASAFFLCLRAYNFTARLLNCYDQHCEVFGSRFNLNINDGPDAYYLRAASLLLRHEVTHAEAQADQGIATYGPTSKLCQMRAMCAAYKRKWDEECEAAVQVAEKEGATPLPALMLRAALGSANTDPHLALQRAARAHKVAPSGHTALIIGRIYAKLGENVLSKRWTSLSVRLEPHLADGWAVLGLLAMREMDIVQTQALLRTARQAGSLSSDISQELKDLMDIVPINNLAETLYQNLCSCQYY